MNDERIINLWIGCKWHTNTVYTLEEWKPPPTVNANVKILSLRREGRATNQNHSKKNLLEIRMWISPIGDI